MEKESCFQLPANYYKEHYFIK